MTQRQMTDNQRDLLRKCYIVARKRSDDRSTQNGAILVNPNIIFSNKVVMEAANSYYSGCQFYETDDNRLLKLKHIEHAERGVIYAAAYYGLEYSCRELDIYCFYAACTDCARAIVWSGIKRLFRHGDLMQKTPERWREEVELGDSIMLHGGVEVIDLYGKIGGVQHLFDKQIWEP